MRPRSQSTNGKRLGVFAITPNHTLTDLKARQSSKIREIGNALITAGIVSLDAQANALGLPRSTTWTILSAEHKGTGISARIICRMLNSEPLPPLVRAKIVEYAKEKAAGIYGGTEMQHRRFAGTVVHLVLAEYCRNPPCFNCQPGGFAAESGRIDQCRRTSSPPEWRKTAI
jgi:hypothetical protein